MDSIKVAVINDSRQLVDLIHNILAKEEQNARAGSENGGYRILKRIDMEKPDVVLLDLGSQKRGGSDKTGCVRTVRETCLLDEVIAGMLREAGIPAHLHGYQYLKDAVRMGVTDPGYLHSVTKRMYPAIAAKNHTTPHRVERAIRHAIEVAWDRGEKDVLYRIFGNTVHYLKGKPTNSEFIATFTDRIRMGYKIGQGLRD